MDLNYINKRILEGIFQNENMNNYESKDLSNGNKIYIFSLYEGYDIFLLIDSLLCDIKSERILGNIYMINFSDYFIKLMNNNYNNIIEFVTSKNKNEIGKIFSLTDRVFLKDLISKEIFISQISAVIISPTTYFDQNEKIWCIQKFLFEEGKNILFFYFLQNQKHFNFFYNSLNKKINLSPNNHHIFTISRNNIIVDKSINRKFQLNKISLIEIKINNNINEENMSNNLAIIRDIRILLEQLLNLIYEEILKNIQSLIYFDNNNNLNHLIGDYYKYRTINNDDCINNIHFNFKYIFGDSNFKLKCLYYDLLSIKFLLKKCESYDIASLYNIFKEIKNYSENENSIFSYQDSTTENLIFDLCNIFKNNLFTIKNNINRIISEEEAVILDEFFDLYIFINMDPDIKKELRNILENNIIELKCDNNFFKINYSKYIQLINILESKIIKNNFDNNKNKKDDMNMNMNDIKIKKEEVLIITNNECIIDNFKSIFNIYGLNKKISNDLNFFNNEEYLNDNKNIYKEFFEYNFRRFLINRREFLNRYKILSNIKSCNNISNYYKENLLLHYLCYQLTRSFDIKHEGLFDRIYDTYQKDNNEIDLLPSEFAEEITEDIFNEYIQQNFNEEETFPYLKIDYISLNHREYYKKEISLIEKLRNNNYSKIILFDYNTNILKSLECFITNYNQTINCIVFFIDYNSYNFKIDFNNSKIESLAFKNLISELKKEKANQKQDNNYSKNKNYYEPINIDEKDNQILEKNENNKIGNTLCREAEKYNIIVDFREMGTKTPYYLYKNNFNIINGSLEVGDYILTNNYCIERKSISTKDLYQSLNSKHLIEQTIKMGKYYKNIIILLEFEENIDILSTFEKGIFYKPIILRKLLDLTNITELEKNNCLFMWSLNCKMTSIMLKSLKIKLNNEILDIDYCLHINKINKGKSSKDKKKNSSNSINDNSIFNSNSQKVKTIDSFFNLNKNKNENNIYSKDNKDNKDNEKNKDEENIKKYETQNYGNENYTKEIKNKKLDISSEKIIRNVPGINSSNYNLINKNFNNLYDFITCEKEKKFEIFGRINGTKMLSLFNYEYQ